MHARLTGLASLILMLGTTWTAKLSAHALLDTPAPRDQQDGYKDGTPCGVMRASSQPVARYMPGQALNVEWLETVDHSGCFLVEFSAQGDQDFQVLGRRSHSDPPPPASPTSGDPRPWSLQVTLPDVTCAECTLRLRQIMVGENLAEEACPPATVQQGSVYTTCANITLGSGSMGGSNGAGGADGTPSADAEGSCALPTARRPAASLFGSLFLLVALCYRRAATRLIATSRAGRGPYGACAPVPRCPTS
jgi:hypothetical protein